MGETIKAIYDKGVLKPLRPLSLPDQTEVELQIIQPAEDANTERQQVRQALQAAGLLATPAPRETPEPVSDAKLEAAARALGQAGPLSELIIAEREGR